jgi:hypothetical protein
MSRILKFKKNWLKIIFFFFFEKKSEVMQYKSVCIKECPTVDLSDGDTGATVSDVITCSDSVGNSLNTNLTTCATVKCDPT